MNTQMFTICFAYHDTLCKIFYISFSVYLYGALDIVKFSKKEIFVVNFDNRVVLLTGAAQGLGLAYARTIAENGGMVLLQDIGADRDGKGENLELVHRTSETLSAEGLNAMALTGHRNERTMPLADYRGYRQSRAT